MRGAWGGGHPVTALMRVAVVDRRWTHLARSDDRDTRGLPRYPAMAAWPAVKNIVRRPRLGAGDPRLGQYDSTSPRRAAPCRGWAGAVAGGRRQAAGGDSKAPATCRGDDTSPGTCDEGKSSAPGRATRARCHGLATAEPVTVRRPSATTNHGRTPQLRRDRNPYGAPPSRRRTICVTTRGATTPARRSSTAWGSAACACLSIRVRRQANSANVRPLLTRGASRRLLRSLAGGGGTFMGAPRRLQRLRGGGRSCVGGVSAGRTRGTCGVWRSPGPFPRSGPTGILRVGRRALAPLHPATPPPPADRRVGRAARAADATLERLRWCAPASG